MIKQTFGRASRNPSTHSLRAKVTLGIVLPLVIILGVFTAIEYMRHRAVVLDNLSLLAAQSGRVIENNLRHAMVESNFTDMQIMLDSIGEGEDFRLVYLLDTNGKVIFAPKGEGVGNQLDNSQPDCLPCHRLPPKERPDSIVVAAIDGQRVFRSMYPIKNAPECSACHDPNIPSLGLLLTDIPVSPMEAALAGDLRENLLWWVGTIFVTVIIVSLVMNRVVIRRLEILAQGLSSFGKERLNLRLPVDDPDEIGQLAIAFNKMEQRIEADTAENQALSEHLRRQSVQRGELLKHLISAQEDERKRVARELHDDLGQALSALSLQADVMERLVISDTKAAIEQLEQIKDLITGTTARMYDLILALRPSALDDLGIVAAMRAHAEQFLAGSGITFELNANGQFGSLSSEIETALYRIFQEALSNTRRYSEATKVSITLALQDGVFEIAIEDNGRGFDPNTINMNDDNSRGFGLLGIQERVSLCGGHVEITSQPGSGTRIFIRFSLEESNCV